MKSYVGFEERLASIILSFKAKLYGIKRWRYIY